MKTKIKPFTKFIINQNIPYMIIAFILLLLTLFLPSFVFSRIKNQKETIAVSERQLAELQNRKKIIEAVSGQGILDLKSDVATLQSLVPDAENYFSLIDALEKLSAETGLLITTYSIPFRSQSPDKLTIAVGAVGNRDTFINFLKNYNFSSGRLITIDKVELGPSTANTFNLNLTFYHKKAGDIKKQDPDFNKVINRLNALKSKVKVVLKNPQVQSTDKIEVNYPVKSNPF